MTSPSSDLFNFLLEYGEKRKQNNYLRDKKNDVLVEDSIAQALYIPEGIPCDIPQVECNYIFIDQTVDDEEFPSSAQYTPYFANQDNNPSIAFTEYMEKSYKLPLNDDEIGEFMKLLKTNDHCFELFIENKEQITNMIKLNQPLLLNCFSYLRDMHIDLLSEVIPYFPPIQPAIELINTLFEASILTPSSLEYFITQMMSHFDNLCVMNASEAASLKMMFKLILSCSNHDKEIFNNTSQEVKRFCLQHTFIPESTAVYSLLARRY